MTAIVVGMWYFPYIFKHVTKIIKYCDVCQCVIYVSWKKVMKLHPILDPLKVWSEIGIDLIGPTKDIEGYGSFLTAVDDTIKFV